jgi:hypothetical protein
VGSRQELLLAWQVGYRNNEYECLRRDEAALLVSANGFPSVVSCEKEQFEACQPTKLMVVFRGIRDKKTIT